MDEKIDDSIDKNSGFKFNPIDETVPLPIAKQVAKIGVEVTPPEAVSGQDALDSSYVFGSPVKVTGQKEEAPGFFSTAWHEAVALSLPNTAWKIGSTLYKDITDHSPVPEGWTPYANKSYYENTDEKYWPTLASASSPLRQQQKFEEILQEMKDDSYFSKGPLTGKLAGGLAGFYGSGANFIKVAAFSRYSTMSETVLKNAAAMAPGLGAQALSSAVVHQLGRAGTDIESVAEEALTMLAVGGLIHGVTSSLGHAMHIKKLDKAKEYIKGENENFDVHPVLNEKGVVTGYKATPMAGKNIGAAETQRYNDMLNEKINESGLMSSKSMQKFFGNPVLGSTVLRMKTGRFATSAAYLSTIARNRFTTVGEAEGVASNITASEYHQEMQGLGYRTANRINELYYKSIGLPEKGSYTNKVRAAFLSKKEPEFYTQKSFGQDVMDAVAGNIESPRVEVNLAAKEIRDFYNKANLALGKAMGLNDVAFTNTKSFLDYMPLAYNHEAIKLDQVNDGNFVQNIVDHLTLQDEQIENLIARRDNFNSVIQERQRKLLDHLESKMRDDEYYRDRKLTGDRTEHLEKETPKAFQEETKALAYEMAELKKSIAELEAEKSQWWDDVLNDPDNLHLMVDGHQITPESRALGKEWFSGLSEMESLVSSLEGKFTSEAKRARAEAKKAESQIYKSQTQSARGKAQEEFRKKEYSANWIEQELERELSKARTELRTERNRLDAAARNGAMPRVLYKLNADGKIEFVNPNRAPELMQHFGDDAERRLWAEQRQDRILGRDEAQINEDLFKKKSAESDTQTAFLKKRDRTIPYSVYNKGGFLADDVTKTLTNYADSVGKRIGHLEAFKNSPHFIDSQDVADLLTKEYREQLAHIKEYKDPLKRKRELSKLNADFERAKADINGIHNAYFGNGGSNWANGFNKAFSMYASAAFMGGLPIAMTTDIGQQIMRHGLGRFMAVGAKSLIKTMNGHIKTKDSESIIRAASDANVGLNVLRARVNLNQLNVNGDTSAEMGGWFSRSMQFSGLSSGQISFANYLTDMMHTMTSGMASSRVMRNMIEHAKDGKISSKETQYMASLGLDMDKLSKRFVEQFNKYGRKSGQEYYPEHTSWDDLEAYGSFRRAIHRDVTATHFEGSKFDNPLWSNNPFVKPLFTFQSWGFAAFNNITVPLLQGIDGHKAMGIMSMIFLGMMQEPMRAYINGREYEEKSTDKMVAIGLLNSGVLGQFSNLINMSNAMMGGKLFPGFLPEKYRDRSVAGTLAGVPGSIADTIAGAVTDLYTGKATQKTAQKFQRLIPLIHSWETRRAAIGVGKQLSELAGLPESSRDSTGWGWWEYLNENKD